MLACIVLAISLGIVSVEGAAKYPEDASWGGACATGQMQSPIDLDPGMAATVHSPITYKNYFNGHFNKHHKGKLVGSDCAVDWYPNAKSTTKLMGGKNWRTHCPNIRDGPFAGGAGFTHTHAFYLSNIHFHWGTVGDDSKGSEHTVGNMSFPLEMHMVHVEDQFIAEDGTVDWASATKDPWGLAVLSVLFKVVHWKAQNMEPLEKVDDKVWEFNHHFGKKMRSTEEEEEAHEEAELEHYHNLNMRSLAYGFSQINAAKIEKRVPKDEETKLKLNIGAFIRKATRNGKDKTMSTYWTYKGSLTTPDCNEAVTWVVFQRALPIAQVQANAFASLCPDTFRKPQPLNGRTVQYLIHKPVQPSGKPMKKKPKKA
jgi:carbonic anhydrase